MKPSQMPAWTGILRKLRGEGEAGGERLGRGLRGGDDLEELHHVGRAEEVEADEAGRVGQALGDGAGVEVGGVGGEDGVGAAGAAEGVEDGALDGEVLEDGLDDEIGVGEGGVVGGGGDAGHARGGVGLGEAAALDGAVEDAAEVGEAAGERLVVALDEGDGEAGVAEGGGDAGAHGAAADDGGGADGLGARRP